MVAVIAFSLFIDYFLYGMFLTLAAHSPSGLQTEAQMAWLYGAYAASALVITPLVGYIGTRTGGRTVMVCGLTLAACATTLFGFASDLQVLFLGRLFEGAASAALWTAGLSLVAAHYTENRVEMIGYAFTGSTAGSVLGPIAGGLLSHIGGYRLPFLVTGLLIAVAFVGILSICPRGERSRPENLNLRAVLMNKALIPPALVIAAAAFAVGLLEPLLPVRWAREGMTSETTGLI
ncbi:MAG: MFS transporter, partial [Acidobacteriaceae bacterium]|nr:MFS transporter [Acidobacteriaceae bacterium]